MDESILEIYRSAGRISAMARNWAANVIEPGMLARELQMGIEKIITDSGAYPSFPAQTSRNNIAAHYCSSTTDDTKYESGDLVKIDLGAHINGYPVDTGISVDLSPDQKWQPMIDAASDALDAAIGVLKDGIHVGKIGQAVENSIHRSGFNPITNLAGHGLSRWTLHAPPQIPNTAQQGGQILKKGMIFAIEPFVTDGRGYVRDHGRAEIFRLDRKPHPSNKISESVLKSLEKWHGLPIAMRYFPTLPKKPLARTFKELLRQGVMEQYPPLIEISGAQVGWKEHTIFMSPSGPEIITE